MNQLKFVSHFVVKTSTKSMNTVFNRSFIYSTM